MTKNAEVLTHSFQKAFDLFIKDRQITIITTWKNQKSRQVKDCLKSCQGFAYDAENIKIKVLIRIIVFLGSTKSLRELTSSIWAYDEISKLLCIAAINQKRFIFLLHCLRFDDFSTRNEKKVCEQ